MLRYTEGTLLTSSGQYCEGEYLLVAVLVTWVKKGGRIRFWTGEGPTGGQYRGQIRCGTGVDNSTQWFATPIPLRGFNGGYVEFVNDVEEVIIYCLTDWKKLT